MFQNPWVVGIVTGIISGILVYFITKFLVNRKDKTEYYRKVKIANDEVIATLKPYIADRGLPRLDIFDSLIVSLARIHQIQQKDMYSVDTCCEELIREIISDVYVSNDRKEQYACALADYRYENKLLKKDAEMQKVTSDFELNATKTKYNKRLSFYSSVLAAVFGFLTIPITLLTDTLGESSNTYGYFTLVPLLVLLLVTFILTVLLVAERLISKTKRKNRDNKTGNDDERGEK